MIVFFGAPFFFVGFISNLVHVQSNEILVSISLLLLEYPTK